MKPHPWFYPIRRRILTTAFCAGWLVFEIVLDSDQTLWFWLALFATGYAVWSFFISDHYKGEPPAPEVGPGSE